MASRTPKFLPIFIGAAANGAGISQLVNDFKNIQIDFATSGSANMIVRVQGSFMSPESAGPNFAIAPSVTNRWDYIGFFDLQDSRSLIKGDDGIVLTGTDDFLNLLVNVDGIVWVNMEISSFVAGALTTTAIVYNNQ